MIFVNAKYFRLRHAVKNRIQRSDISKAVPNNAPIIFKSSVYLIAIRKLSVYLSSVSASILNYKSMKFSSNADETRFIPTVLVFIRNLATRVTNVSPQST